MKNKRVIVRRAMAKEGVALDFFRLGKTTDNAFIEAFNSRAFSGRFRAECLNLHWFLALATAVEKLEAWRRYYNQDHPHSAIVNRVPLRLDKTWGNASARCFYTARALV